MCEEALAKSSQSPQRQLGEKITFTQSDLGTYGPPVIQVLKRRDEKREAKAELKAAKLRYSEACKAFSEVKHAWEAMFAESSDSEHAETIPK